MVENKDIVNGLDRAARRASTVLATIEIKPWFARALKEDLGAHTSFCRIDVVEVLRVTPKAVQIRGYFNTNVAANCYVCGAVLTTEVSKASGIGPTCASNCGVPRASRNDAKAIIEHMNAVAKLTGEFTHWIPKSQMSSQPDWSKFQTAAPKKEEEPKAQLAANQIQVPRWLAMRNNHPQVLTVLGVKKETPMWYLLRTTDGEIGIPKSQIIGGKVNG